MTIRNRIKELRNVLASSLKPNPKNWRTHPQSQSQAMRGILAEIGYADSLIARELPDGSLMLIDGHLRAETTPDEMVPVQIVDLTEAEADKLLLSLDPLAAMAESNAAAMQQLCDDAETNNAALQAMWDEMQANVEQPPVEIVEDEVPEPPVDPITKPGDLWLLGEHRVLCGDSTKAGDVARLMAGAKADLIWTDPPYGVNHIGGTKDPRRETHRSGGVVHNDDRVGGELIAMVGAAVSNVPRHDSTVLYVASPPGSNLREMIDAFNASGFEFRHSLVWVKSSFVFGRCDYHYRHEMLLYGWGRKHEWTGPRDISTVFEFPRGDKTIEHPTSKPVGLVAETAKNHPAAIMADPFLGSGTTLIAAEQLGRKCYGMEISPAYCDVIVKRWETLTGKKATLEITDGKTRPAKTTDSAATTAGKSQQAKDKRTRAKA